MKVVPYVETKKSQVDSHKTVAGGRSYGLTTDFRRVRLLMAIPAHAQRDETSLGLHEGPGEVSCPCGRPQALPWFASMLGRCNTLSLSLSLGFSRSRLGWGGLWLGLGRLGDGEEDPMVAMAQLCPFFSCLLSSPSLSLSSILGAPAMDGRGLFWVWKGGGR